MNHGEGDVGESAQPGLWFNERLASENCNDCGDNDEAEYNEEDYEPDSDFHENNDGYEGDSDDEPVRCLIEDLKSFGLNVEEETKFAKKGKSKENKQFFREALKDAAVICKTNKKVKNH